MRINVATDPTLSTIVFKRIYVCLGALKVGFKACKRELLGLDDAFMRGPFPGQLLSDVGIDSNSGIYPLAYAGVEAETKESWIWFLQCLLDDLDSNFTFISDRQKVFNGKIVCGKHKLIIIALEYVREYCMKRIVNVQKVIGKSVGPLTPIAANILDSLKKEAVKYKVLYNGTDKFQPINGNEHWEKSTMPTTVLHLKHHVTVGRLRKRRTKRANENDDIVKDGKLSEKGIANMELLVYGVGLRLESDVLSDGTVAEVGRRMMNSDLGGKWPKWYDKGFEEEELWENGIEKIDYTTPLAKNETFEVHRYTFKNGKSFISITNQMNDVLPLGTVNGSRFIEKTRKEIDEEGGATRKM
ncbi:heat stress transcription factor B-4-like protein [Tanacetum coccineum]